MVAFTVKGKQWDRVMVYKDGMQYCIVFGAHCVHACEVAATSPSHICCNAAILPPTFWGH